MLMQHQNMAVVGPEIRCPPTIAMMVV